MAEENERSIAMTEKKSGYYFGTEVDGKWYRRYMGQAMFIRGNGKYWFCQDGLYFHKYLTSRPLFIAFADMKDVQTGAWHSGKWGQGHVVVKIIWGDQLSSGFFFTRDKNEVTKIVEDIRAKIANSRG